MGEQFNNVAEMGPEGDAADVEIRDAGRSFPDIIFFSEALRQLT